MCLLFTIPHIFVVLCVYVLSQFLFENWMLFFIVLEDKKAEEWLYDTILFYLYFFD